MSIERCGFCDRRIDTDKEDDCYVSTVTSRTMDFGIDGTVTIKGDPEPEPICKTCQDKLLTGVR
jgi:hypothetical protein